MTIEWWSVPGGSIDLYVDFSKENSSVFSGFLSRYSPSAYYYKNGQLVGYHYRMNEGVNILKRLGIEADARKLE